MNDDTELIAAVETLLWKFLATTKYEPMTVSRCNEWAKSLVGEIKHGERHFLGLVDAGVVVDKTKEQE